MTDQPLPLDLPPAEVDHLADLSADQRRTIRRARLLDAGTHPTTRQPLVDDARTCRDCPHLAEHTRGRTFYKCGAVPLTRGPATDVRLGWPACVLIDRPVR